MSSRLFGRWPQRQQRTDLNHPPKQKAALGRPFALDVPTGLVWGGLSPRLRRRGRPADFVSVPRTLTGALKAPAAWRRRVP